MKKFRWLTIGILSLVVSVGSVTSVMAEGTLKQNFKQVDITTVIEAVAKISGYNIIIDPRVKGKVTFIAPAGMNPDELYQSLLAVLRVHGYAAIEGDNAIKIIPANMARDQVPYTANDLTNDDWVTEVISVKHVEATKLVAVLRPLIAKEGHLVALADSNKLIVTDVVSNIKRLKHILKRVDVDTLGQYEVIPVLNSSAEELNATIQGVIGKSTGANTAKVSFDARSNSLILSGDEQKRIVLRALIAHLDVKVASESRVQVIYLRYAKAQEIAEVLRKVAGNRAILSASANESSAPPSEGGAPVSLPSSVRSLDSKQLSEQISIEADERMNALVISAPFAIAATLKSVIKQLDIRRAQVLIEAIFVEISEDKAANLGVEWALLGKSAAGILNFSGALPSLLGQTAEDAAAAQANLIGRGFTVGGGALNDAGDQGWGALITALNSDSSSNILATPSILTLDNEEAEILVGREVPFQTGSFTSGNNAATNPFNTIERHNVGLKLKVKPQINEGNEIYLDIDQEISDVLPKGEAVDIQTTKRQIKTRVIVGDGNVVVLGGLVDEKETQVDSKVPGLGDIPWLGGLFRSTETVREKVNLMLFLRPVIIRDNMTSDYYSQKKYSYIVQEQNDLLEKKRTNLLGDKLRPRLPALQEWQGDSPTPAEKLEVMPRIQTHKIMPVEPVQAPKGPLPSSAVELLDL